MLRVSFSFSTISGEGVNFELFYCPGFAEDYVRLRYFFLLFGPFLVFFHRQCPISTAFSSMFGAYVVDIRGLNAGMLR